MEEDLEQHIRQDVNRIHDLQKEQRDHEEKYIVLEQQLLDMEQNREHEEKDMRKKFKHLVLNMVQAAMSVPVAYALVNWEWNLLVPLSMINCFQAFFVHSMQYLVQDKEQHRDYLESAEEDKRKLQKDMDCHKSDVDNLVYLESLIKDRWYDHLKQIRLEQRMQE